MDKEITLKLVDESWHHAYFVMESISPGRGYHLVHSHAQRIDAMNEMYGLIKRNPDRSYRVEERYFRDAEWKEQKEAYERNVKEKYKI